MTSDADLQPLVGARYRRLVADLTPLSEADWETPSLCEGWRIREVIAHLTMPVRYDQEAFMAELEAHQFDFTALMNDVAGRDGQLPVPRLMADLASDELPRWTPPDGGYLGALSHVVIHGLDATVPLGLSDEPDEADAVILDGMTKGGGHQHFDVQIEGRRFEASDLDWGWGQGPTLRGPAGDLIAVMAGRRIPAGRLQGAPL